MSASSPARPSVSNKPTRNAPEPPEPTVAGVVNVYVATSLSPTLANVWVGNTVWMPRPEEPVTIPSDPAETSIPLVELEAHQLLSSGSAPFVRSPSAQESLTMTAASTDGNAN